MKTFIKLSMIFLCLIAISLNPYKTYAQIVVGIGVTVREAPPALPVYDQPICPEDGYLWTPGYWAYGTDDYYWVPGVWVMPPQHGYLWTPCYWGYSGGYYGYHSGYWGQHVGFYGGVNYGYGYGGSGYGGGRWVGHNFQYNSAVMNVNSSVVHNTYVDRTVINNTTVNRTSFNGEGGTSARPTTQEEAAGRENHVSATSEQTSHEQGASKDRNQFASVNKGQPATTAMNKVGGHAYNPQGKTTSVNNTNSNNSQAAKRNENTTATRTANNNNNHEVSQNDKQLSHSTNPNQKRSYTANRQTRQTRRAAKQVAHQQKSKGNNSKHG